MSKLNLSYIDIETTSILVLFESILTKKCENPNSIGRVLKNDPKFKNKKKHFFLRQKTAEKNICEGLP